MFSLKVANIVKLEDILFMLNRWSKPQNSAWEQGKSNSAYPNYAKKYGSQLLLRNASRLLHRPLFQKLLLSTLLIISMTFSLNLTQMLVFLSLYVILSIHLSNLLCAAASLFWACLISVHVSLMAAHRSCTPVS